jgi:exosortase/archaeosortase family protein
MGGVIGLVLYALAVWMAVDNDMFRRLEARMLSPLAGWVTGRHGAVTSQSRIYFAVGTPRVFGLQVTSECTSALLLIPLFVMMGSFAVFTRLSLRRQVVAVFAGAALILAVNAVRVAGIAWATWKYGFDPGYSISHVFVGSAFSLVGFVGAMLMALWILVRGGRRQRALAAAASTPTQRRRRPLPPRHGRHRHTNR